MPEEKKPETPEPKEPPFFEQFTREFRQSPEAKRLYGYAKPEQLAKALLETQAKLERALPVPAGENPDPAEVKVFREKLGIPDDDAGYEFDASDVEGVPEQAIGSLRKLFHDAELTKSQAKTLAKAIFGSQKAARAAAAEAEAKRKTDGVAAAKKRSEAYKAKLLELAGGEENVGGVEELYKATMAKRFANKDLLLRMAESGLIDDPAFVENVVAMAKLLRDDEFIAGETGGKGAKAAASGAFGSAYSADWIARTTGGQA